MRINRPGHTWPRRPLWWSRRSSCFPVTLALLPGAAPLPGTHKTCADHLAQTPCSRRSVPLLQSRRPRAMLAPKISRFSGHSLETISAGKPRAPLWTARSVLRATSWW